jgi:hypothetical protein
MVGASFTVAAAAEVLRSKKGITAVGNAQVDTAQSKFGGASALFDGTGDYLLVNGFSSDFGTGDFTIETWIRFNSIGTQVIYDRRQIGTNSNGLLIYYNSGFIYHGNGSIRISGGTASTGVWYHLTVSRSSGSTKMFLDGTQIGSTFTDTLNYTVANQATYIAESVDTGAAINGYLDEVRISNSARYTTTFTPSTTPFVNDANTLFLMHANGTDASTFFEDDNGVRASRSLIAIGNAQVDTAQSKFGGSALLCDGTGDYVMSTAGTQWDFSTSSFTIEYFIRFNAINTLYVPIALRPGSGISNGEWWCEITAAENKMYWGFKNQAGTQYYVNLALAGTAFATGQFYHIALVNNAGTAQMYVNGTATGATTSLSGSFGNSSADLWVGAGAGAYSLNGWLDEVRISNTARYTSGFTPTTTPFVNDSNTLLLIHADGTDASTFFEDDNGARAPNGIAAKGNAQVSTAQSKFGGASALFDGTGDYLTIPYNANISRFHDNTNFTLEYWVRVGNFSNVASGNGIDASIVFGYQSFDNYAQYWSFGPIANGNVQFFYYSGSANQYTTSGVTLVTNTWYHLAVVKQTNSLKIYVDGVERGSGTISNTPSTGTTSEPITIGSFNSVSFNGYLDEIRVSNTARYTAAFTPSTTPFQSDANTLLLIHADGTNGSTAIFDDNGIAPYTP